MINYSRELLAWYVNTSIKLYGPTFQTYNVHSLIHLPNDVTYFKDNLDNISAFRFENRLKTLKSMIRNSNSPLAQIIKRVSEKETAGGMRYKKIETKVSVKEKDNWFVFKGRRHIVHIVKSTPYNANLFECELLSISEFQELFSTPCNSKTVDIFTMRRKRSQHIKVINRSEFYLKLVCMPLDNKPVFVPMKN